MKLLRAAVTLSLLVGLGCASGPAARHGSRVTSAQLLAGTPLGAPSHATDSVPSAVDVLAPTPAMRAFLDTHVNRNAGANLKLRQLVSAVMSRDTFGLQYDERTRTAAETFRERRGNCLSFSTMFVALARDVGLSVQFQEVDIPPDWTQDKETFVLNRHVNVRVLMEPIGSVVVDFNTADFRTSYDMRPISDDQALAHYYNNIGVERMLAGDLVAAVASYRAAIADHDPQFSAAWTNLGTLYMRHGNPSYAEAAYLHALDADPNNLVVMSNLARLYDRQGDSDRAARYRRRVLRHRMHNPYYRYQLAREAFAEADYDGALHHLKYATRKKKDEEWFYSLLGECYEKKGNRRAAERAFARAHALSAAEVSNRGFPTGDGSRGE
ncbi:MAG: tetratricopeptide repeat protein [Acidobacteria bacterium]|nr:tetratricopeptide repeat protein [Acidobacteriota bacterium]